LLAADIEALAELNQESFKKIEDLDLLNLIYPGNKKPPEGSF